MSIQSSYTAGEDVVLYKDATFSSPVKLELRITRQTQEHLFARLVKMTPDLSEQMTTNAVGEIIKFRLDDEDITDSPQSNPFHANWLLRDPLEELDEAIEKDYQVAL